MRNYQGTSHLVVDVYGYYIKPMAALVSSAGNALYGTDRVVNAGRLVVGQYWVQFNRNITTCQPTVTPASSVVFARADTIVDPSSARIRVYAYNSAGVPTDASFHISMTC